MISSQLVKTLNILARYFVKHTMRSYMLITQFIWLSFARILILEQNSRIDEYLSLRRRVIAYIKIVGMNRNRHTRSMRITLPRLTNLTRQAQSTYVTVHAIALLVNKGG